MNDKMEEFKTFVRNHPGIKHEVDSKNETWQSIYEKWDILGESDPSWTKHKSPEIMLNENTTVNVDSIKGIMSYLQKVDPDKIMKYLGSIQKVISVFQSTTKGKKVDSPQYFPPNYNANNNYNIPSNYSQAQQNYNDWWN